MINIQSIILQSSVENNIKEFLGLNLAGITLVLVESIEGLPQITTPDLEITLSRKMEDTRKGLVLEYSYSLT